MNKSKIYLARLLLPFLTIFSVFLPVNQAYAVANQTQTVILAAGSAYGGVMTASVIGIGGTAAGAAVLASGTGAISLSLGMYLGPIALCSGLTLLSGGNNPCTVISTGTGANGSANTNPTSAPLSVSPNSLIGTYYGIGQSCCAVYGATPTAACTSAGGTYLSSLNQCTINLTQCTSLGYSSCTSSQNVSMGGAIANPSTCSSGYQLNTAGTSCNLTNGLAVAGNNTTTVTRSGTTLTVNLPSSTASNPNQIQVGGGGTTTVTAGGVSASTGKLISVTATATSTGTTVQFSTDNNNGTIQVGSITTDQNGNITGVGTTVTQTGSLTTNPNTGVVTPTVGGSSDTSFNPASAVIGVSGVIGTGVSGVNGASPSNSTSTPPLYPGSGSGSGSGSNSGSGTGGCVGTLATPCYTEDVTMTTFATSGVPSDTTGNASAVAGFYASAVAAAAASGITSAIASQVGVSTELSGIQSSVTGVWSWYWPAAGGGTVIQNCQSAFGGGGNTINQLHGNTWIDLCANSKFLELPALLDWFLGMSVMASIFVRASSVFDV